MCARAPYLLFHECALWVFLANHTQCRGCSEHRAHVVALDGSPERASIRCANGLALRDHQSGSPSALVSMDESASGCGQKHKQVRRTKPRSRARWYTHQKRVPRTSNNTDVQPARSGAYTMYCSQEPMSPGTQCNRRQRTPPGYRVGARRGKQTMQPCNTYRMTNNPSNIAGGPPHITLLHSKHSIHRIPVGKNTKFQHNSVMPRHATRKATPANPSSNSLQGDKMASGVTHNTLGLSGGAAGVQNVARICGSDCNRLNRRAHARDSLSPCHVSTDSKWGCALRPLEAARVAVATTERHSK